MSDEERGGLNDKEMLFTLVTALVKRTDGEIRISEDEMDSVTKQDMVMMYLIKVTKRSS